MRELNRSRKDIKKGCLSFIDTWRNIRQEKGLRRVCSEDGPMGVLYGKIYSFDKQFKNES